MIAFYDTVTYIHVHSLMSFIRNNNTVRLRKHEDEPLEPTSKAINKHDDRKQDDETRNESSNKECRRLLASVNPRQHYHHRLVE